MNSNDNNTSNVNSNNVNDTSKNIDKSGDYAASDIVDQNGYQFYVGTDAKRQSTVSYKPDKLAPVKVVVPDITVEWGVDKDTNGDKMQSWFKELDKDKGRK